jgi:hypothetical protein
MEDDMSNRTKPILTFLIALYANPSLAAVYVLEALKR